MKPRTTGLLAAAFLAHAARCKRRAGGEEAEHLVIWGDDIGSVLAERTPTGVTSVRGALPFLPARKPLFGKTRVLPDVERVK